ncbi:hypothetical protein B0T19DRAFT_233735 [Cercophora scortea]|uniref:WSC domain-containing protein n=1 Tax=Cercophora scortea TaxID=314031 RepID=A0AAE0IGJ6_9PEZI|nr:hypothetical protein B0T19DRAFT_233735 [Cercophora scortea]
MAFTRGTARTGALLGLAALFCGIVNAAGPSVPVAYCANSNTADMDPIVWNWQSEGRCFGNCTDLGYALAVVQARNCWCTNLIPNTANQEKVSLCSDPCPGYPDDVCGGDGLYGYLDTGKKAAGTATPMSADTSSATAAPSSSPTAQVSTATETSQDTVQSTVRQSSSSSSSSSSAASTSTAPPTTGDGAGITQSSTQQTVQTVTVGGVVKTVTATPDPTGTTSGLTSNATSGGGLGTGPVVGIVVGVIAVVAIAAIFAWMWFVKRKKRNDAQEGQFGVTSARRSSSGIMGTPKSAEMTDTRFGSDDPTSKRRSHLMPSDPRLDPFAKGFYAGTQNKSHESISSFQDNQDYSRRIQQTPRVLRAVNPDPDDD